MLIYLIINIFVFRLIQYSSGYIHNRIQDPLHYLIGALSNCEVVLERLASNDTHFERTNKFKHYIVLTIEIIKAVYRLQLLFKMKQPCMLIKWAVSLDEPAYSIEDYVQWHCLISSAAASATDTYMIR